MVTAGLYFQPMMLAKGRKSRIDLDLPYAITYMQALSSTLTLYNIFRSVYEQEELYGEVSREFGMIVRDVEFFRRRPDYRHEEPGIDHSLRELKNADGRPHPDVRERGGTSRHFLHRDPRITARLHPASSTWD